MGKAYLGVSDDASAITWNPAGLISHDKPIVGLSYTMLRPRGSFVEANGAKYDFTNSYSNLTYLSFLSPVRIRGHQFVLAASYSQTFEDFYQGSFDQKIDDRPHDVYSDAPYDYRAVATTVYHANPYVINFGFGTPVSERMDVGASINVATGKAVSSSRISQYGSGYRAIDRLGQEVFRDSSQSSLDSTSFSGVNFTLGGKYENENLTVGMVVKTGYSLKLNTDGKYSDSVRYNGQLKSGGTVFIDDQVTKYNLPWVFGFGFGYKMQPNWILALDLEYRGYASTKGKVRTSIMIGSGGNNEEVFTEFDPRFYDCFVVRTGTEFLWTTNSTIFPIVPLRFGLGYVPVPAPSISPNGTTEQNTMYQVSAGTGVRWNQIWLDLSYVYSTLDQTSATSYNGLLQQGEINGRDHRMNLTFTGYF
jgi:hypothetical protein